MNYELAQQLKDAGFPQEMKGGHWMLTAHGFEVAKGSEYLATDGLYLPTLEELISAIPELDGITRVMQGKQRDWTAFCRSDRSGMSSGISTASGKSPIEAVANLWLILYGSYTPKRKERRFCSNSCDAHNN